MDARHPLTVQRQLETFTLFARRGKEWRKKAARIKGVAHQYKDELRTLECDGVSLPNDDRTMMAAAIIGDRIVQNGIRLVQVSENQATLFAQTDLHAIPVAEWQQSYPVVIVQLPDDQLAAVSDFREINNILGVNLLAIPQDDTHAMDHAWAVYSFENSFDPASFERSFNPRAPHCTIGPEMGRIVINAVLHLANYRENYGTYPSRHLAIKQKIMIEGQLKKVELIPQIIKLRVDETPIGGEATEHGHSGGHVRPHWRRDTGDEWPVGAEGPRDGPFGSNLY